MSRRTATCDHVDSSTSSSIDPISTPRGRSRHARHQCVNHARFRHPKEPEEPFHILVFKVGSTLLVLCMVFYAVFVCKNFIVHNRWGDMRNDHFHGYNTPPRNHPPVIIPVQPTTMTTKTSTTFPTIDMDSKRAEWDAFGIASFHRLANNTDDKQSLKQFQRLASRLREQFANRLGGQQLARAILQQGLVPFESKSKEQSDGHVTNGAPLELAKRIRSLMLASNNKRSSVFSVIVVGSSAAAGLGNFHNQSYAFVLEDILRETFASLGVELQVQNSAMDHITEFPFTWCHVAAAASPPDLLIWDFGFSAHPHSFEAFLRNLAGTWNIHKSVDANADHHRNIPRFPLVMFRDAPKSSNNDLRDVLIQTYVDHDVLVEPTLVHFEKTVEPFRNAGEAARPPAFRDWLSFGGPRHAPGKEHTHLTAKQHEMIAWLVSMQLLAALELAVVAGSDEQRLGMLLTRPRKPSATLPPPVVLKRKDREFWKNDEDREVSPPAWVSLLVGDELPEGAGNHYQSGSDTVKDLSYAFHHNLQCRTSFVTAAANDSLKELIVGGAADLADRQRNMELQWLEERHSVSELLLPKGSMFLTKGWVEDLDKATKRKVQLMKAFNFMGFQDMIKKAYFGLPSSNVLSLFLPLSPFIVQGRRFQDDMANSGLLLAHDYVDMVVLCETDLPKHGPASPVASPEGVCRLHRDAVVFVGGVMAFLEAITPKISSSCVFIVIPETAHIVKRQEVVDKVTNYGESPWLAAKQNLTNMESRTYGISVEVKIRNELGALNEPCSLAHVIWNEVFDGENAANEANY